MKKNKFSKFLDEGNSLQLDNCCYAKWKFNPTPLRWTIFFQFTVEYIILINGQALESVFFGKLCWLILKSQDDGLDIFVKLSKTIKIINIIITYLQTIHLT